MKNFIITTDTTSDLPQNYIEENNIPIHALYYELDGIVYGSKNQLSSADFYSKMRSGYMPTTMASNPEESKNIWVNYLEKDYDILHISFSSGLSSSYSNFSLAANELMEEYPEHKIIVIDSLCASLGEGLLVHKALELKEKGKSLEEITIWLEENKLHLCHLFTVDDLHHLHRGGRVSKATAIIGTMIHIKPVLHVDKEGKLIPLLNVRGRKRSLNTLADLMEKQIEGYENHTVFISHGDCLSDAEYVANLVTERFGIKDIIINNICPTIGAHSGPNTIALFFMGKER